MSNVRDIQSKTFGSIAAVQTIVENYPSLKSTDSIMGTSGIGTSLGYMLSLLRIIGLSETDIYDWISKLLCGESIWNDDMKEKLTASNEKVTGGILNSIEYAVKAILFANIKDLFGGCPIQPMIPDWLIEEPGSKIDADSKVGLKINLGLIDTFGVLKACPCDSHGSIFYFDTIPNIYGLDYNVSDVYKSTDFNAFLWYVINKSGANGLVWDNRVNVQQDLLSCVETSGTEDKPIYSWPLYDAFFDDSVTGDTITKGGKTIRKKSILRCRYIDTGNVTDGDGLIKVTLPESQYRRKINENVYINKTIFEFNYDYIFSLKLFEAKTLVANIINSMLSLGSTIGVGVSFEKSVIRQYVEQLVKKVMESESDDDSESEPCFKTFSNEQYDSMLKYANMAKDGLYEVAGEVASSEQIDTDGIVDKIKKISKSEDQKSAIQDAISFASDAASFIPGIPTDMKFACDITFIYNFLQQTVTEIVTQILSPKVIMLYSINSAIMGDIANITEWEENFTFKTIEELLIKLHNLIISIIKQCLDLILKELFNFLMEKIGPMIKIFTMQLLLETIRDYKDLISQLITTCTIMGFNFGNNDGVLDIDNVQYADIVPVKTAPGNNNC